ncbi:GGDEF domain-containing protein [Rhizobium sp. FY34]|uniref:GGDEF domain-containing protein n=1 Tax=Rhizobium sp. FY34 TaxID=2562309 RepID=UPI0010BFB6CE|nr:GGDEF domain-containing protein [Rhizobium sp. FY34]
METKLYARSISEHAAMVLAMEHLPVCVALFTLDGKAVYMNRRFREFYHPQIDDPIHSYVDLADYARSGAAGKWGVDPQAYFEAARQELLRKGWNRAQVEIGGRIMDVHDVLIDGQIIVSTQKDITDHILAERQMSYLARHDVLTGLANRAGFEAEAERLHHRQAAENRSFSLLMADLDLFKSINDVHGHAAGDAVLREIGRRFHECLDGQDFAARFGGDEFVFLTPEDDLVVNAKALAQRLAACVAHPVEFEGNSLTIGVTIGYATFPRDAGDIPSLTRAADQALYTAKAAGRGSVLAYRQAA